MNVSPCLNGPPGNSRDMPLEASKQRISEFREVACSTGAQIDGSVVDDSVEQTFDKSSLNFLGTEGVGISELDH